MTDVYFCPHRGRASPTKFYIITLSRLLHVFAVLKDIFKEGSGALRRFHLFWRASRSNWKRCLGFARQTVALQCDWYRLEEGFDTVHGAMSVHVWPGYGMLPRQATANTRRAFHFRRLKEKQLFSVKIPREEIKKNTQLFLIQSISAAAGCCVRPLHLRVLLFLTWISAACCLLKARNPFLKNINFFFFTLVSAQRKHKQFIKCDWNVYFYSHSEWL